MTGNRALEDNDVSEVLQQVRIALSRAERTRRTEPLVVEPMRPDAFGVRAARERSEVVVDQPLHSARPVIGPAITLAKRTFRRLVRWYVKPVATQQSMINLDLLGVSERLGATVVDLQRQLGELSLRLDALERGLEAGAGAEVRPVADATPDVRRLPDRSEAGE